MAGAELHGRRRRARGDGLRCRRLSELMVRFATGVTPTANAVLNQSTASKPPVKIGSAGAAARS